MVYRPMNLPQSMQLEFYRDPRTRLAERFMAQGADTSPVQHWTQGAGRLAQALLGGWLDSRSRDEYQARADKLAEDTKSLFAPVQMPANEMDNGGTRPATLAEMLQRTASISNPDLGPLAQQLAMTHATTQAEDSRFKSRLAMELEAKKQAQAEQPETFGAPVPVMQGGRQVMVQFGNRGGQKLAEGFTAVPNSSGSNGTAPIQNWAHRQNLIAKYGANSPEVQSFDALARAFQYQNQGGSIGVYNPINPGAPAVAEIPKTLPPEQTPQVKGKQTTAVETAQAEVKKQGLRPKAEAALLDLERKSKTVTDTISKARSLAENSMTATGYGNFFFGGLPNTDARALNNYLDTIKANIGFDRLQAMRESSPTGGALGSVSEMENRLLQAVQGALDPLQADQLIQNLKIIEEAYPQVLAERRAAFDKDYGGGQQNPASPPPGPANPGGPPVADAGGIKFLGFE